MYNHQKGLARAIGTMYRNRGPRQEPEQDIGTGVAGALGGMVAMAMPHKPVQDPNAMANAIKQAQMADAIQRAQIQSGMQGLVREPNPVFKEELQRQDASREMGGLPFGNRFSHSGYQDHVKQTTQTAQDIETSKQLMGLGMGMSASMRRPEDL